MKGLLKFPVNRKGVIRTTMSSWALWADNMVHLSGTLIAVKILWSFLGTDLEILGFHHYRSILVDKVDPFKKKKRKREKEKKKWGLL